MFVCAHSSCTGYFGSGISCTALYPSELYAESNPKNERGELVLVMAFVQVGNAYPVTREADYDAKAKDGRSKLYGKPLDSFFDTHFVRVDPDRDYEAADTFKRTAKHFHEIVIKDPAQVLPRFLVYFDGGVAVC